MEVSSDPYEQKLFQMFTSCDTNHCGALDENALSKLCEMLELQDRGSVIIKSLIKNPRSRVSFGNFKEALLNFLGTEIDGSLSPGGLRILLDCYPTEAYKSGALVCTDNIWFKKIMSLLPNRHKERTLILNDESERKHTESPQESSDREVSPKFVVGAKKYGRRSRPQFIATDSSPSESDDQDIVSRNSNNNIVQRSSSQSDILSSHRRRPLCGGAKLKRCASLPAQKNQRVRDAILEKTKAAKAASKVSSSVESLGNLEFENLPNRILEVWKTYGSEIGTYYFTCDQLQVVCERVGVSKTFAESVVEEVFDKLRKIKTEPVITFSEFISLISGDNIPFVSAKHSDCQLSPTWQNNSLPYFGHMFPDTSVINADNNQSQSLISRAFDEKQSNVKDIPAQLETVPTHSIIEMWERANISSPKGLLLSLGFDEDEVNILQLSKVLEEELRGLGGEAQTTLLKASLALQTAELSTLKQSYLQLSEENKKLHSDNKDANRRVVMLAQEIDERHANLEDTTKKEIRLLEQRHAEVVRDLTARMANDRENWSNLTSRLESRIKSLEQEELKLRLETESLRQENGALENEQTVLQKQITGLLETNIQLNKEIVEFEEKNRTDEGSKNEKETEEMLELIEKITSLQMENSNLRDKNDELVAEVEGLNFEISRQKPKRSPKATSSTEEDPDHTSAAVKRRGDSPSKTRITEESPRLGKFRRCNADTNSESDTSGDWVALNSELKNPLNVTSPSTSSGFSQDSSTCSHNTKDQEITSLKTKISQLEEQLKPFKENPLSNDTPSTDASKVKQEKDTLEARCKELEGSLEQMQKAYEDCEDYWQDKLAEERQLFEKERKIYEEEQKESDVKFTELVEKVREYEEQFSKDGRLSPIEEKDALEQQYADLEAEADQIRENARQIFEEKRKEIESLQCEIEDLRVKLGESVEILTGANEMQREMSDLESPASSPISYLWHQSTIQSPVTQYKSRKSLQTSPSRNRLNNLSTSETTVFSTTQPSKNANVIDECKNISPIQKPISAKMAATDKDSEDSSSTASAKSFESQSVASTHSIQKSSVNAPSSCSSPNIMKEELKRLKFFEIQLKDQIKDLALQRDGLIMELQQLQEAKPVLEKAYARAAHPSLIQRVNHLELKNRHLQNVIKQQHQYTESLLQQTWQQQHAELSDLRNRLETQGMIMTEQTQRLANADVLVKELYVENSHLTATIQRLEQQMCRVNLIHQHQSLSGLPGMP